MSTAHAPGPWSTEPSGRGDGSLALMSGRYRIAIVHLDGNDANARLIAAAPEMLAALKGALDVIDALIPGPHRTIREAIARAEGRA